MEEQIVKSISQLIGWIAFAIASLVGWAVRTSVFNRLTSIEDRIIEMEKIVSKSSTRSEVADAMREVKIDLHNIKMEIKADISQILQLRKGD